MTTPATSNVKPGKESAIFITTNGCNYDVQVILFNSQGESKFVDSSSFNNLAFETNYNTPFLVGSLTVDNNNNLEPLNKLSIINQNLSELNTYGDGLEFIKIKITYIDKKNRNVRLLDKVFVTKNKSYTTQANNKQTVYYFTDIVYTHFNNKRLEWSTDLVNEKQNVFTFGQNKINAGLALRHLLIHFSGDQSIVDEDNWDYGIGTLYYTLPANVPALHGIKEIMKSYVATDESSGLLTYYNGKFQLRSFKKYISNLYKNNNVYESSSISKVKIGRGVTAAFKIQTNDIKQKYSKQEGLDLFGKEFEYIPIDINSISFNDIQPDITLRNLAKNEVIQFSSEQKKMTIHSNLGTLTDVAKKTGLEALPDGDTNTLNIDENKEFNIKNKIFKMSDEDSTRHYGTIKLQKELLNSLTKATFSTNGNIDFNANKFIYLTMDLTLKNKFAHKVPGFWYITNNLTTISKNQFTSNIECVKLDKPV